MKTDINVVPLFSDLKVCNDRNKLNSNDRNMGYLIYVHIFVLGSFLFFILLHILDGTVIKCHYQNLVCN